MQVVSLYLSCVMSLSSLRIFMPKDLRPVSNRTTVANTLREVLSRYNGAPPTLDPYKDLKITDETFSKLDETRKRIMQQLDKLSFDPSEPANAEALAAFARKTELMRTLSLREKDLSNSSALVLSETLGKMKRVLRRLGYIDEMDVVQAKGRIACEINSADELLLTELIYDGLFIELTPVQCVAILASLVFLEKVESNSLGDS